MLRIDQYEEAVAKGVLAIAGQISNMVWTVDEIRKLIDRRMLFLEEVPAGRLWFSCGTFRNQLFFQINRDRIHLLRADQMPELPCVSEVIYSGMQKEKKEAERSVLARLSFEKKHTVRFMSWTGRMKQPKTFQPICFRLAGMEDFSSVQEMHEVCFDRLTDAVPDETELIEAIGNGCVFVGTPENEADPVGSVMLIRNRNRVLIRHVAVAPAFRHRGIGAAMMGQILSSLRTGEKCVLWVKEENDPAIRLYEHMGFEPQDRFMEIWVRDRNKLKDK